MNNAKNNLEVEIYKTGDEYKARVIWFDDSDDKSRPMVGRLDIENPDETLRTRKVLGLEVMHGLNYNPEDNDWEDGKIYDVRTGREWSARVWITKDGYLKVRVFWQFEFIGQSMSFKKVI